MVYKVRTLGDILQSNADLQSTKLDNEAKQISNTASYMSLAAKVRQGDAFDQEASNANMKNKVQNVQLEATLAGLSKNKDALESVVSLGVKKDLSMAQIEALSAKSSAITQVIAGARGYDDLSAAQTAEELREVDPKFADRYLNAPPNIRSYMHRGAGEQAAIGQDTLKSMYLEQNKSALNIEEDTNRILTQEGANFRLEEQSFDHTLWLQEHRLAWESRVGGKVRLGKSLSMRDVMGDAQDMSKSLLSRFVVTLPNAPFVKNVDPSDKDDKGNVLASAFADNFTQNLNDVMKPITDAYNQLSAEQKSVTTPPDPLSHFQEAMQITLATTGTNGEDLSQQPAKLNQQKAAWKTGVESNARAELGYLAKQDALASGKSEQEAEQARQATLARAKRGDAVFEAYLDRLWVNPVARGWTTADAMEPKTKDRGFVLPKADLNNPIMVGPMGIPVYSYGSH